MFRFSILSAFRRKLVSALAIIGVGLGSGLLVSLLSLSAGTEARFNKTFQDLSGTISVIPEGGSLFGRLLGVPGDPLPASYASRIERLSGVDQVAPYVSAPVRSNEFGPVGQVGIGLTGIDSGEDLFDSPNKKITQGRGFNADGEVIAGKEIYEFIRLSGAKIGIGDKFAVPIKGSRETIELTLVGVFETGSATNDRGLFGTAATVRKLGALSQDQISGILVRASNPSQAEEVANSIGSLFKNDQPAVSALVATDVFSGLNSFLNVFQSFLLGIALIAFAAGGTSVMVVMLLTVFGRRKEFGILKAAGWSNGNIIFSVIVTSLTLSFLGVALGLAIGTAAAVSIQFFTNLELTAFNWGMFAWAGGMGILTGLVGGLLPAIAAANVSPIETLRGE